MYDNDLNFWMLFSKSETKNLYSRPSSSARNQMRSSDGSNNASFSSRLNAYVGMLVAGVSAYYYASAISALENRRREIDRAQMSLQLQQQKTTSEPTTPRSTAHESASHSPDSEAAVAPEITLGDTTSPLPLPLPPWTKRTPNEYRNRRSWIAGASAIASTIDSGISAAVKFHART